MNDPFAEFYDKDGNRIVMTAEELEASMKKLQQEPFPNHWDMFEPPEVKRIRPEAA